jgi:glycosyltransferase involved in cell wall biosynthesis
VTIALDATPLAVSSGGVRRYTEELSRALARAYPDDRYWLVSDQSFPDPAEAPANLTAGGKPRNFAERKWWAFGLDREMRRLGADIFHGTDFSVPYSKRTPAVMTLHDLSPWMDPAWQPDAGRVRRRTPFLLRGGFANMVITPSESVRRAAMARFGLAPERVVSVPLAAAEGCRAVSVPPPERPYFLFVGTLEPRKNIARLIDAWREVRTRHDVDLVLAGRVRSDFAAPSAEPGLRLLGAVAEEELAPLYSGAIAVVYPSLYEGFGLPVLEAMQCGAAVITSRDPAITEVAEGATVQVDALDTKALATAMEAVVSNPENFVEFRAHALRRSAEFSWERTARKTREVYDAAIRLQAK